MMQAMKVQSVGRSGKGVVKGLATCFFGVENLEDEEGPPPQKKNGGLEDDNHFQSGHFQVRSMYSKYEEGCNKKCLKHIEKHPYD